MAGTMSTHTIDGHPNKKVFDLLCRMANLDKERVVSISAHFQEGAEMRIDATVVPRAYQVQEALERMQEKEFETAMQKVPDLSGAAAPAAKSDPRTRDEIIAENKKRWLATLGVAQLP